MDALVGTASFTAGGSAVGTQGLFGAAGEFGMGGTVPSMFSSMGGGTLLNGLMTGAAAYGHVSAGNSSAALLNLNAAQADINARMETIKGREQALTIKNQLNKDLASQNALFSARGVLHGEGSALAAGNVAKKNAAADLEVAKFGADTGSESDKLRAAQDRISASAARKAGKTEAISTVVNSRSFQNLGSTLLSGL